MSNVLNNVVYLYYAFTLGTISPPRGQKLVHEWRRGVYYILAITRFVSLQRAPKRYIQYIYAIKISCGRELGKICLKRPLWMAIMKKNKLRKTDLYNGILCSY